MGNCDGKLFKCEIIIAYQTVRCSQLILFLYQTSTKAAFKRAFFDQTTTKNPIVVKEVKSGAKHNITYTRI